MIVPLFDCRIPPADIASVEVVLKSGHLATGAKIAELERQLSVMVGGREVIAISNMTQALEIALRICGIGPGDRVLTQSFNCLSSNAAISNVGAVPEWVDIDPQTATMDVDDARASISARTRAIVVYHTAGYIADIPALKALAHSYGLPLIEDANAALGGVHADGSQVGSVGDFAVFSFYANRQVNAIEGAALVCPDPATAERARRLRRYGIDVATFRNSRGEISPSSDVPEIGLSASLNNINATLALGSLSTLGTRLELTRRNAKNYWDKLDPFPSVDFIRPIAGTNPAPWVMLLTSDHRDAVVDFLHLKGIAASSLHQPNHVYSGFGAQQRPLPGTKILSRRMFAVPIGWWVKPNDCDAIMNLLHSINGPMC